MNALLPGTPLDARQKLSWLRLLRSENVGPATFRTLINHFGGADAALEALPALSAKGGLNRAIRICSAGEAEAELAAAERLGATLIAWGEPGYPPALAHADGAAPLIYLAGKAEVIAQPLVAIVGSRNCSAAGRRIAQDIAAGLAGEGVVVVSGLARGIDTAAHRASLAGGTVAVLAGGHGHIYPPENVELASEIRRSGAVVSEMPPGWVPRGKDFPRRNRIISGMSAGVVVIEAAARSGSLITARLAGEQGRDVLAVPGSPLDPRSEGTNRLIRDGATLVRSHHDVMEALGAAFARAPVGPGAQEEETRMPAPADIDDDGRREVQEALSVAPVAVDEIIRQTGLPSGVVMTALIELELAGRLERHPGQRVSLL